MEKNIRLHYPDSIIVDRQSDAMNKLAVDCCQRFKIGFTCSMGWNWNSADLDLYLAETRYLDLPDNGSEIIDFQSQ